MRPWLQFVVVAALAFTAQAGEVIDRIVATVNTRVVLQSEWEDTVHYEALVEGRPLDGITAGMWQRALNRLVDQELLRQQMHGVERFAPSADDVQRQLAEIRKQYATDAAWRAALAHYGLSEADLRERVTVQLHMMRFIDYRLRPNVHVDGASIEGYYRDKFLPELKRAGGKAPPLTEVSAKIEEVLVQQKMDELLSTWLNNLRSQSKIRITTPVQEAEVR